MINEFMTVYAGHIDISRPLGQNATPANDRRYSNDQLASVFPKAKAIAKVMDECGYDTLWLSRASFPARRLRVPAEHSDVRRPSCACHQEAEDRLRLQHHADVAPATPRRGSGEPQSSQPIHIRYRGFMANGLLFNASPISFSRF